MDALSIEGFLIMAKRKTQEEFIKDCKNVHGDLYDYSMSVYKNGSTKINIICNVHGVFSQLPSNHLVGNGCPGCGPSKMSKTKRRTKEEFIDLAEKVHKGKYKYDDVEYINGQTKVTISCRKHGSFSQKPYSHLEGAGCYECRLDNNRSSKKQFSDKAKKVHEDRYLYDKVKYVTNKDKVKITCKEHGVFEQRPDKHLVGEGCPVCSAHFTKSKAEKRLSEYVSQLVPDEKVISGDRELIYPNELDVFIPNKKLAIEYNGLHWHSDLNIKDSYHLDKTEKCLDRGTRLVHLFEDEWADKKCIVKSRIVNLLGTTKNKIYARKCEIREVCTPAAMTFLDSNHLQGRLGATIKLGLYYNNSLVSLMTFGKLRKSLGQSHKEGHYELLRFCNVLNTSVVGGASKLLKYFENVWSPCRIISYADRRWSEGDLYYQLGFELVRKSAPNYFYTKGKKRESRFKYRKSELIRLGWGTKEQTEREIMSSKGYNRIYDCGALVFHKTY